MTIPKTPIPISKVTEQMVGVPGIQSSMRDALLSAWKVYQRNHTLNENFNWNAINRSAFSSDHRDITTKFEGQEITTSTAAGLSLSPAVKKSGKFIQEGFVVGQDNINNTAVSFLVPEDFSRSLVLKELGASDAEANNLAHDNIVTREKTELKLHLFFHEDHDSKVAPIYKGEVPLVKVTIPLKTVLELQKKKQDITPGTPPRS
ncbi:MAG: hypothetical protein EBR02_09585 [Alphaproteobacteria bacterium]|nr:hypothetical protein [Alphaproteobacteria bacterium]